MQAKENRDDDVALPQGLTIKFNTLEDWGQVQRLFAFLDSIFSLSLLERFDDLKIIDKIDQDPFYLYAHAYEQYCKEHLSWLEKFLNMIKLGEGLDFTLKDFGFREDSRIPMQLHETPYKVLIVIANPKEVIMRVSFVIKSNNYAPDFSNFLLVKKNAGI